MSRGRRSDCRPCTAAFTMLIWLDEPIDLDRMSLMPAHSIERADGTAGDDPGPGRGRLQEHARPRRPAPITVCGIVVPIIGTSNIFGDASSTPLAMAAGTSLALP